jgi:hypothetical protein
VAHRPTERLRSSTSGARETEGISPRSRSIYETFGMRKPPGRLPQSGEGAAWAAGVRVKMSGSLGWGRGGVLGPSEVGHTGDRDGLAHAGRDFRNEPVGADVT